MTQSASHPHQDIEDGSGLFAQCPACASRNLVVADRGPVVFACPGCARRWRYSLGHVWSMPPGSRAVAGSAL